MQDKEFLGTAPVGRLLAKLAIPTVLAQLVNMLYNIVDRIYIGRMPLDGDLALTGVGLCMPLIYIVPHFVADKTMGVYLAEPIADILAVLFTAILFTFQFRKALREMEQ